MCRKLICVACFLLVTSTPVVAQLPAGWTSADVGGPAAAGSARYDQATRTWTIQADGTGIRERADQFHYVYKPLVGDGELAIRVVSIEPVVDEWAMAGAMIRIVQMPGSPYVFMGLTPNGPNLDHGATFYGRAQFDGPADHTSSGQMTPPYWIKVSRVGDTFSGFHSPDGKNWTLHESETAPGVPKNLYIGLAVTSDVGGKLVTAILDNGPVTASNPDPPDDTRNVGAPLLAWTAGATATGHDVYVGTDPDLGPEDFQGRLPAGQTLYFHAPGLVPGTIYYWRIDEVGTDGKTIYTGDVWSFSSAPATAYNPQPLNGDKAVGAQTRLSWRAGVGAASHDVYFGTDKAAVKAADASVFKGNQVALFYDPDALADDTTYYWRIDERDESGAVHVGAVWTFKTVGPSAGVKAEYFKGTELSGTPILTRTEASIDHPWGNGEVAGGLSDGVSARWTAGLEAPLTETYRLITTSDDGVRLWLDGRLIINNWTDHGTTDDAAQADLIAGQVYSIRMEWYENGGGAVAHLSWQSPSLPRQIIPQSWLQLPSRATTPYPANGSAHAAQSPILHWSAGDEATHHDIYFGEDAEAVTDANTSTAGIYRGRQGVEAGRYQPEALEWGKTYYWRVDEVNAVHPDSPWTGVVWSFTTANFVVVDDFESYTDDSPYRLFQTWLDGFGYTEPQPVQGNGTGSTVGNVEPPFAEQKIVHEGYQAMVLAYDNSESPWYSETERTWSASQDWTVNGVDTLTLYFRGLPGNEAQKLYVALQDSAGRTVAVTHPDPDAVLTTKWTEWRIAMGDFAPVDAAAIKMMYIGLGDRSHPTPGGTGTLYIDDIRVIGSTQGSGD